MIKTAISFALGCVVFLQLATLPSSLWLWALLPACSLLLFDKSRLLAVFTLGILWALLHASLIINNRLAEQLEGQDIVITGIVDNIPEYQNRRLRFEFKPDQQDNVRLPTKIRLNWYQPLPDSLHSGEHWQLTVRLKRPHGMANPSGFDYEQWLFQQGIGAVGYVRASPDNKRLAATSIYSINAIRQSLIQTIETQLNDSRNIGLVQGLTTGVRHNINLEQWQILRLSGTNHLLAISGLHIGLAAAIGFFCLRWIWSRRSQNLLLLPANEAGAIGGFLTALFYAALAGFSLPSQRALIMVATVMLSLLIRRSVSSSHVLAASLLLVLVFDPLAILAAGFWLSFSAVAIILLTSQYRWPSPRWQWAKIHGLIAFGLTPLLLIFFMQTSLIAPIANFIAVPIVSLLVVPVLLLSSLFLYLFEPIGILLLQLADIMLSLLWPILKYLAALPFSHWSGITIPTLYWLPIIVGTLVLLSPKKFPAKWIGLIGLTPLILYSPAKPNDGEVWFSLLDVGQGLATVIQTKNHTLVYDTGPKFSDEFNTGTAVVLPFLQYQGIKHIDTLVISHGDNDHIGGAIPLIDAITVDTIVSSTPTLLPSATSCQAGQSWHWDNVNFSILHPQTTDRGSENNLSCVLKISSAYGSILLTGDIEAKTERLLVKRYGDKLRSTLLVAPHHGSNSSSTKAFINAVQADFVLFATGYRNRYHFPNTQVVERYQNNGITLFNTAVDGAIQFKLNPVMEHDLITARQSTSQIWTSDATD
ncbi:MAG: DNA internalization-related competence protein ComEC/Rec2 [Methylophagaceae bacterium]